MSSQNLTNAVIDIIKSAESLAKANKNAQINPAHLACATFQDTSGIVDKIVKKLNVKSKSIIKAFQEQIKKLPSQTPAPDKYEFSLLGNQIMRKAQELAADQGDTHVAVDHLLLSLYDDSQTAQILASEGANQFLVTKGDSWKYKSHI